MSRFADLTLKFLHSGHVVLDLGVVLPGFDHDSSRLVPKPDGGIDLLSRVLAVDLNFYVALVDHRPHVSGCPR